MTGYISGLPHFSSQITWRNPALLTRDLAGSSVQPCCGTSTTNLTYCEGHAQNGPPWELTKVYTIFHVFYHLTFTYLVHFLSSLKQWQVYENRGLFSNIISTVPGIISWWMIILGAILDSRDIVVQITSLLSWSLQRSFERRITEQTSTCGKQFFKERFCTFVYQNQI